MKNGIAVAGNLTVDHIKYIERYPSVETLTTICDTERTVGGLACNCALALAVLDPCLPVKVIGILGDDDAGDYIISRFNEHEMIDTSRILRKYKTSFSDVMTNKDTGTRTLFTFSGANSLLKPEHSVQSQNFKVFHYFIFMI